MRYLALIFIMHLSIVFAATSAISNESIIVTNNNSVTNTTSNATPVPAGSSAALAPIATTTASNSLTTAPVSNSSGSLEAAAMPANGQTTTSKLKRHKYSKHNIRNNTLAEMTFDFDYSGDISSIPMRLRSYDSHLSILRALGTKKAFNINISLQGAKIEDIADAIATQTNDQVHLMFNLEDNSVRLNYIGALDVGRDAVSESLRWQQGKAPRPVLKPDGVVRFPYGEYQPVITCQPLNLCDIELQAGEDVQSIVIGDSQRWNEGDGGIPLVFSGSGANLTPHLVLKPNQAGLDTTLLVTTSKRTYMLRIKSAYTAYVARAGFYYPGEMIQKFNENKAKLKAGETEQTVAVNPDIKMPLIDLSKVNYGYLLSGDDYSWKPTQVFDDGISVYIQLPDGVSSRSLPGLCILVDGDESETKCEMANFRFNDHFYIVDKLFNQAKLINGYGDYMQTITIKRKPDKPGFWARLFS